MFFGMCSVDELLKIFNLTTKLKPFLNFLFRSLVFPIGSVIFKNNEIKFIKI